MVFHILGAVMVVHALIISATQAYNMIGENAGKAIALGVGAGGGADGAGGWSGGGFW
jgi:hypothetical protein